MRLKLLYTALIIVIASAITGFASTPPLKFEAPSDKMLPTLGMVRQLSRQHYIDIKVDDNLSSRLLDEYVKMLDPAKLFFTKADVTSFEPLRHKFDDELSLGEVDSAFTIYNVYHKRVLKRLSGELAQLDKTLSNFDFDKKEYIDRDPTQRDWGTDQTELDDRWRKRLKNDVLSLKLAKKNDTDIADLIKKRLQKQLKRFEQTNSDDIYTGFMNTYAALYDPHTSHFLPSRQENFDINMSRSLEGIGAVLSVDNEHTKVVRLVAGGPAEKQGALKPSDRIIGVGQGIDSDVENVVGWRLDEVVELIRGPKDSFVRLQVASKKEQASGVSRNIIIRRGKVQLEDMLARSEVLELFHDGRIQKVGVINIPDFYADTGAQSRGENNYRSVTRDVERLIEELKAEGIEGLVVDLRNNGGGSLTEANNLTGLFINAGPTVQIRYASNRVQPQGKFRGQAVYDGPLVVMINRLSASASEIFAGAIQDYDRGLVVGSTSYGKGTVQTIIPLAEGSVKLTTAKFYRITGDSTQYKGVIPDISFPEMVDPEEVGESALDNALPWDNIQALRFKDYSDIDTSLNQLISLHEKRVQTDPDFVYFQQEIALSQAQRKANQIPLQIAERQTLQQDTEAAFLKIENARRKAKGLELLSSVDALRDNDDDEEAPEPPAKKSYRDDAFAVEAGNILLDSISLGHKLVASTP